jgi:hypothetical protein
MSSKMLQLFAGVGGLTFIASGATEVAHHQGDPLKTAADYGIEVGLAAGLLLSLAGLYKLHLQQERDLSSFGVWAFRVAACGQTVLGIVAAATILRGQDALGPLFPLGVLAWGGGTLAYAVATAKAAVMPRWVPVALAVGTVTGIAVNPGGAVIVGALWLALAATVLGDRSALRPVTDAHAAVDAA